MPDLNKPIIVFGVVAVVTVVLMVIVLLGLRDGGMFMTSQRCRADMQTIICSGSIGQLRGASRLDFYDSDNLINPIRSTNWDADITLSVEAGELAVSITDINGEVSTFTVTPERPLQTQIAVERSIMGSISAQLAAQGGGEEEIPSVDGIVWEATFSGR